jgi:hypothetical protein
MGASPGLRLTAWLALAGGLVVGLIFYSLATQEVTRVVRLTGHGFATYEYSETRLDPLLASAAGVSAAAGLAAWAFLLHRAGWRWRGKRVTVVLIATTVALAIAVAATVLLTRSTTSPRPSEHYTSINTIAGALARGGVRCMNLEHLPVEGDRYWRASAGCGVRSEFGIPDGFDNVSIHVWKDDDARQRWLSDPANEEVDWVASPTWLLTCEFIATCIDIRRTIGGELNVEY